MLVLPQDIKDYGINPETLNVAFAVRMSMSIPFFYEPVVIKNMKTNQSHFIVDGGLLSNFPVWLFDSEGAPEWPTFGLRLVEEDTKSEIDAGIPFLDLVTTALGPVVPFLCNLASTALEAHDRMYIESANFSRTIPIPTLGISTLAFNLEQDKKNDLYAAGRKAAEEFLETWNFGSYVATFRSDQEYSRRQEIQKRMQKSHSGLVSHDR